jgi:hypothetical protein
MAPAERSPSGPHWLHALDPEVPDARPSPPAAGVVHGYFEVDLDFLWDVAIIDVPDT